MEVLREKLKKRGAQGIRGLARNFKICDRDGSRSLDVQELAKCCSMCKLGLSLEEVLAEAHGDDEKARRRKEMEKLKRSKKYARAQQTLVEGRARGASALDPYAHGGRAAWHDHSRRRRREQRGVGGRRRRRRRRRRHG